MSRQKLAVATFLFFFLCFTIVAKGQELAGTLTGTVTDSSGAAIPGATVTIAQNGVNGVANHPD